MGPSTPNPFEDIIESKETPEGPPEPFLDIEYKEPSDWSLLKWILIASAVILFIVVIACACSSGKHEIEVNGQKHEVSKAEKLDWEENEVLPARLDGKLGHPAKENPNQPASRKTSAAGNQSEAEDDKC